MKIGDLVSIKKGILADALNDADVNSQTGVVLDVYEDMTTVHYEVQFTYERGWFDEFELELINSRDGGSK